MAPGGGIACCVGLDGDRVVDKGPVLAAGHVVLSGPHQLHRPPGQGRRLGRRRAGGLDALHHIVARWRASAAEGAAGEQGLDLDGFGRDTDGVAHRGLVPALGLATVGQLHFRAVQHHRAVHRLHGGVGQVGEVIGGLEQLAVEGAGQVTVVLERDAGYVGLAGGGLLEVGQDLVGPAHLSLGVVPRHLQRLAALLGGPGGVGEHGHA